MGNRTGRIATVAAILLAAIAVSTFAAGAGQTDGAAVAASSYSFRWTYGYWGDEMDPQGLFERELEAQFPNIDFVMEYLPQRTLNERYAVIVASRDMPEILTSQGTGAWVDWVKQGAFVALDEYLPEFTNITTHISPAKFEASALVDGQIWGLPVNWQDVGRVIAIRKDWLDMLGLDEPRTVDELYEVARAFTYDDPNGSGTQDTWGFTLQNEIHDMVGILAASYEITLGGMNSIALYRTPQGAIELGFLQPGIPDFVAYVQRAWADGIIEPASLTRNQNRDAFKAGTVGIHRVPPTEVGLDLAAIRQHTPDAELIVIPPLVASGYEPNFPKSSGWFRMQQITNSVTRPDEVRAILGVFDWLLGDGYWLVDEGVEGETYTVENGRKVPTEYWLNSGYSHIRSIIRRSGPEYQFSPFDRESGAADDGIAIISSYLSHARTEPIHIVDRPPAQELVPDVQRIRLEGLMQIIVGDRPLSYLPKLQAEWRRRGADEYLEQVREMLGR